MRYFVDKNPVFLTAPEGAGPTVGFAYIQAASDTTAGLRTDLAQYRRLLKAVPAFRLIFVTTDSKLIPPAKNALNRMLGSEAPSKGLDPETRVCWTISRPGLVTRSATTPGSIRPPSNV